MILFAVALFAALTFALSQQGDSGKALSSERLRLLASEVVDMGSKMSDTVAQIRLKRVPLENISFQNEIVDHYDNLNCTTDTCRVFVFAGGGRDWETPSPDISNAIDWGYTGDLHIKDVGTDAADLVALLPNLSEQLCNRINIMLGHYGNSGTPPTISAVAANKFTGTFASAPVEISGTDIDGHTSGCVRILSHSGTAFASGVPAAPYTYYEVLAAR